MEPEMSLARRLWQAIEPIHATVYFHPDPTEALKTLGMRGFWMCYFAGRFAPLGAVGPGPAAAMAYGFAPRLVSRALPDAWGYASPADVLTVRIESAAKALESSLPTGSEEPVGELARLLQEAATACRYEGRPLAAGWLDVERTEDPVTSLWLTTTVLREHRGDGHVLAGVSLGLRGLDAILTHVAVGGVTKDMMLSHRGWTEDQWDAAERRLHSRGILTAQGKLTKIGGSLRRQLEEITDRLASGPVERLGPKGVERVIELADPISRHLIDTGVVPFPNPIGVPRL